MTRRLRASLRLGWAPGVCVSSTFCWATQLLPPKSHCGRFSKEAEHTAPPMGHSVALGPNALIVGDSLFALLIALDVSRASSMSANKSKGAIHVNEMMMMVLMLMLMLMLLMMMMMMMMLMLMLMLMTCPLDWQLGYVV